MRIEFFNLSNIFSTIDKYIPQAITRVALAALAVFGTAYAYYSWQKRKFAAEKGLEDAVRVGNLEAVQRLMQGNANLIPFVDGKGLLSDAVKKKYFTVADFLKQQGANLDVENMLTGTPLYYAAFEGNLEGVQWLLSKGANPDRGQGDVPPLAQAILGGKFDVVKFLINNGASLEFKGTLHSPLYLMGKMFPGEHPHDLGFHEIIRLMFSKGAILKEDEKGDEVGKQIEAMRAAN